MKKTHFLRMIDAVGEDPLFYAICGKNSKQLTSKESVVTCKNCLKKLRWLKRR